MKTKQQAAYIFAICILAGTCSAAGLEQEQEEQSLAERKAEALAKMSIKETTPTKADITAMETLEATSWTVPTLAMEMTLIPAGTFTMGSPNTEPGRKENETPHKVTISRPFYMGVYEVTQAQFYKLTIPHYDHKSWTFYRGPFWEGTAYHYRKMPYDGFRQENGEELQPEHPMECVSWTRAVDFCKRLTEIESEAGRLPKGYEYRLPTEAEWEYACRAGSKTPYNIEGITVELLQAEFTNKEKDADRFKTMKTFAYNNFPNPRFSFTSKVGGENRIPNAWGLYDMHGNVFEWCLDSLEPYTAEARTDPLVLTHSLEKVMRGGGIGSPPRFVRSASRLAVPYDVDCYGMLGFRIVLAPKVDMATLPMTQESSTETE